MIVANYNSSDDHGGAAKAAFRLNEALRSAGVEAFLLCKHKRTRSKHAVKLTERRSELSPRLVRFEQFWMQSARHYLVTHNRTGLSSTIFSIEPFGLDVTEAPLASAARVHHLHWCREFISPAALRFIRTTKRPVFVTLHDQWWMTGGCHYTAGCNNYERLCAECPQLFSDFASIAQTAQEEKIKAFDAANVTVIAPSEWMADCARRSAVFSNADVHVVRNPIDVDTFRPLPTPDRAEMRAELGLKENDVAILFGAQTSADQRKGFGELLEALKQVKVGASRRICLVSFGRSGKLSASAVGIPTIDLGEISDEAALARIYSAADIFVIPSLEDNYPNTVVEALACGTPVVGFAAGGIVDLVDGVTTGLLADRVGDPADLADAISAGIERFFGNEAIRQSCRKAAEAPHDPQNIARQMIQHYAAKARDFHAPLTDEEISIVQSTIQRNGTGKSTFARMDAGSSIFDSEKVSRVLLPLFDVHKAADERTADMRRALDLSVRPETYYELGRGQDGVRNLGLGWAAPYLNGVWTNAAAAHLHFFVNDGDIVNQIAFDFTGRKGQSLNVSISQDGEVRAAAELQDGSSERVVAPITPIAGPGYFNLTIESSRDIESSPDEKPLQIFAKGFKASFDESRSQPKPRNVNWIKRLLPDSARSRLEMFK